MPDLKLYMRPTCPYSRKVMNYLNEHNITVEVKDISNAENRDELVSIGGKQQVPCLVIDNDALYESDDIIEWFRSKGN